MAACSTPSEIVKEKKLKKSNFETYLVVDVNFADVSTVYSAYDGDNPEYEGGRWKWGTATATVTISPKSLNKTEFTDCKVSVDVTIGIFGTKQIEATLDENGCYTEAFKLETKKSGVPKEGFASTDYAVPVATYDVVDASGDMMIYIKLDENGSVIADTEE